MDKFKGIFSALVTPLDNNDNVNTKSLEQLVKFNTNLSLWVFEYSIAFKISFFFTSISVIQ